MRKFYFSILALVFVFAAKAQQTVLIDPAGDGGFENGTTFSANGWTVVNGATNQWFIGNLGPASAGNNSAYISNNATGAAYSYTITSSSVVYFYRDITFPAGQSNILLTFKWKAQGELNYDWICVWSAPTTVTPTLNSPTAGSLSFNNIATTYPGSVIHSTPANLNSQGATYQTQTICLPASYAGTTRRIVFMWSNDNVAGTQPPGSVDEISLVSSVPPATPAAQATGLVLTPVSTSQLDGSFTPASPAATGYVVVRYPSGATPVPPADGFTYFVGATLGTGTVMSVGTATSFSNTFLTAATTYDFYVYAYNGNQCSGPFYKTTPALSGSGTTLNCSPMSAGTYSVGPTGTYTSLGAALSAVTGGTTGNVVFELQPTYSSSVETFPLTFAGSPCPIVGNITVRPAAGATGLVISSANSLATLDFNGGDKFIIDGRPGGTGTSSELSIVNTSVAGVAVRIINDARFNTLTYLDIQGQNVSVPIVGTATNTGVIYIGPAFSNPGYTPLGNDNNTISHCSIHGTPGNTPAAGIFGIGSTITIPAYNDSIVIANNNIYDIFSPGGVTSAIKADLGTNAWTITGNSFYQTAPRSTTATNTHRMIWITPTTGSVAVTASGFVITDNYIGGSAPQAGGAPLTILGAFGNQFQAMDLSVGYGTPTSVQNNVIRNLAISTTIGAGFLGILQTNGHVDIGTITGNTIGSTTATGDITVTATSSGGSTVLGIRAGGGTGSVVNIANNKVGGITTAGTSTFGISIQAITAGGASTVNIVNNLVGSTTVANSINASAATTGSSQTVTGINVISGNVTTISGNTVANMNNNFIGAATGSIRGIYVSASATTISNNIVRDLSTSTPQPGSITGAAIIGITASSTSIPAPVVTGNSIYGLVSTCNTAASIKMTGIVYSGTSVAQGIVSNNSIHSFDFAISNPTAYMTGIDYASGPASFTNNMIRLGVKADGSSLTNEVIVRGISSNSTAAVNNFYHNSIYIGGTGVGTGNAVSLAFTRTSTSGAYDIRNNIFVNVRSNATTGGKHYAVVFTTNMTGVTMDHNIYQYSGNGGLFGNNGVADVTSYTAGWTPSDVHSMAGNPLFANPAGNAATVDLHLTTGSIAEGTGTAIASVPEDYDNQTRVNLTPTDIGADAGNYGITGVDVGAVTLVAPVISGCGSATQAVVVRIKNYSANTINFATNPVTLAVSATGPAAYNSNIVINTGTLASGATIDITLPATANTAVPGTYVFSASTTVTGDGNTANDAMAAINVVSASGTSLSGTYTVGAGGNYATLSAAVAAYNTASCLAGNVVFSLTDALYNTASGETFPIRIQHITNPNNYTLTIRPAAGVNATITTASDSCLIKLNGADNIIIDGSNNGTQSRNLTIKNDKIAQQASGIWIASLGGIGNGAVNNTVKNLVVLGGLATQSASSGMYGIVSSSNSTMTSGNADNDNLTILNNAISKTTVGISALASIIFQDSLVISDNVIGSNTPSEYVNGIGIAIAYANNFKVSGNTIFNLINPPTNGNPISGIEVGTNTTNGSIIGNNINKLSNPNPIGGLRCTGINFSSSGIANITIANNMIGDVKSVNWANPSIFNAIGMNFTAGSNLKIYNNTIGMSGTVTTGTTGPGFSTNIYIGGATVSNVDFRNNILSNTNSFATNNSTAYNIYMSSPAPFTTIDYNDYYGLATSTTNYRVGYDGTTQRLTLNDWRMSTAQDAHSIDIQPVFVSPADLHIDIALGTALDNKGTPIAGITTDIDGDTRSTTTPDIGADEFDVVTGIDFGARTLVSPVVKQCYSTAETVSVRIRNFSASPHNLALIPVTVKASVTGPNPQTFTPVVVNTGILAAGDSLLVVLSNNYNMSALGTYTFSAYTTVAADVQSLNDTLDVVTRTLLPTVAGTTSATSNQFCLSGTPTINLAGSNGSAIQWQSASDLAGPWTNIGTNTNTYTPASPLTATTYYRAYVVCNASSDTSNVQTIAVNNPQLLSTTNATRCGPGTVTLGATGSAGTTFNWYSVATGGAPIGTGPSFTTPILTNNTTYYATATIGGSTSTVGLSPNVTNCGTPNLSSSANWPLRFNTTAPVTINSVWIVPAAVGTFTIGIGPSLSSTYSQTWNITITAAQVGVPLQVNLNYQIPTPGSYQLVNVTNGSRRILTYTCSYPFVSAGGGFIIVGSSSFSTSPTVTSSYNTFFDISVSEGCESPRQAVTATITPAPAFDVTNNLTVCNNAITPVQVNSTLTDFNTYVWTPVAGLYTDATAATAYTAGANVSNLYARIATPGTYTFVAQANNTTTGCQNFDSVKITVLPASVTVVPSPDQLCVSGSSALSINPNPAGFGTAQYQWQSSPNNTTYTNIPSATGSTYTTPVINTTTYYKVDLKNSAGVSCTTAYDTVIVNSPAILSTTPAARCGNGTLNLTATATPNASINWYTAPVGGTLAGTGATFTTPSLSATTTYYVAALNGSGGVNVGIKTNEFPVCGYPVSSTATDYPLRFTTTKSVILNSVWVVPATPSLTVALRAQGSTTDVPGTSVTFNFLPSQVGNINNPVQLNLGWMISAPGNYQITNTSGGLWRITTLGCGYPFTTTGGGFSITGSAPSSTAAAVITSYNGFYQLNVTEGCESPRTAVTAQVSANTAITQQPVSNVSTCVGAAVHLTVGATGANLVYQWRKNGINIPNSNNDSLSFTPISLADAGTYDVVISGLCGTGITSQTITVNVSAANTWTGAVSTDWNTPANWCGGVPTPTTDVVIFSGTPYQPVINATLAYARNVTINNGASITVQPNGTLNLFGDFVNNGAFIATDGFVFFKGNANQNVSGMNVGNIMVNGTSGVTLTGGVTVGTSAVLINGHINLGVNNLTINGDVTGSLASHIVTNSTGSVITKAVGTTAVTVPVGPSATSYNPVRIGNGQGRDYAVRVATGLNPSISNPGLAVNRTWNIIPGGTGTPTNVNLTFQYEDTHMNTPGVPTNTMEIGAHNGTAWSIAVPSSTPSGTPTARQAGGTFSQFGPIVVTNIGGISWITAVTPPVDPTVSSVKLLPNLIETSSVLRVISTRSAKIRWNVIDGQGRIVMSFDRSVLTGQNDIPLQLQHLAAGMYTLSGTTDKGLTTTVKFVKQ